MAGRDPPCGSRRRSRSRGRRHRSLANGDGARPVHGRQAFAEGAMRDFTRLAVILLAGVVGACVSVHGQTAAAAAVPDPSSDPIACWWKTDKDAVLVGEQFLLTLTCSVLESG